MFLSRRRTWILLAAGLFACHPRSRPNLILISIDTLRPDHLSTYGYARDTSPGLTELARVGVRFTAAFVQAPWTIPSHASLLTGRYPCLHGANDFSPIPTSAIASDVPLLAERLKAAGYRTAGFYEETPFLGREFGFARGFDVYESSMRSEPWPSGRIVSWLADRRRDQAPFFLFLHKFGTHGPYERPAYLAGRYHEGAALEGSSDATLDSLRSLDTHQYLKLERYRSFAELVGDYDAMIRSVDDQLSILFEILRGLDLYDNSVIIVTSDHGESFFEHQLFVGHALFLYDEEVHVPLVLKVTPGRPVQPVIQNVVESVDVVPTAMALLGLEVPPDVDGQSLAALIASGDTQGLDGTAMGTSSHLKNTSYVRTARWKYIGPIPGGADTVLLWLGPKPGSVVANRLIVGEQLYDVLNDPAERENLIQKRPEVAAELRSHLAPMLARCGSPGATRGAVTMSEEERRRLQALGYVH